MKNIWIDLKKELFLLSRTKLIYFLFIITILSGVFITYYLNLNFENQVEISGGNFVNFNTLLYLKSNHRIFLGLNEFIKIIFPFIIIIFATNVFNIDFISNARRTKYTYQNHMSVYIAKNIVLMFFNILVILIFILSIIISSPLIVEYKVSDFTSMEIANLKSHIIFITCGASILYGLIISYVSLLLMTLFKNVFLVISVIFGYLYAIPLVLNNLKFHLYGLYNSIVFETEDGSLNTFYASKDTYNSLFAMLLGCFIILFALYLLREVLKWQEKY